MLAHFFWFEFRYWLRSWMLWIFFLIIALLVFAAVSTDKVTVGDSLQNTYHNAPYVIENFYSFMCQLTLLMITAFVNSAASRDFAHNTSGLIFATPLRKLDYLTGRFLGSTLIAAIPMAGITAGILLAKYMPWVDAERWGPVNWAAHWNGLLVFALPNTLFIAAIIFTIAVLTRSSITAFIGALAILTGYGIADALTTDLKHETLAALLDPFGIRAFTMATKYWTVAEKNRLALGATGLLFWNRVIWLSVGAGIFAFAYSRFRFTESAARTKSKPEKVSTRVVSYTSPAAPAQEIGLRAHFAQLLGITRIEFISLTRTASFIVILVASLLNTIPSLILSANEGFGNSSMPVTYHMLDRIKGSLYLFLISMITYYAGVLIWRERDNGADEMSDAMPQPEWPMYLGKFIALLGSIVVIQCLAMLAGVLVQAFSGYHRYQLGLYASELLGFDLVFFVCLTVLAFFIHVISANKYVGYFAFIGFMIFNAFAWGPLNVGTRLVKFGDMPDYQYSDFFGYAPYLAGWIWFALYWLACCGILGVASILLWQRGRDTGWRFRIQNARRRFTGPLRVFGLASTAAFVCLGVWIYYNTEVLNHIMTEDDRDRRAADYEKTYKKYEHLDQPRIISAKYDIELRPESRGATMQADELVRNESGHPIPEMHIAANPDFDIATNMDGATVTSDDRRLGYRIYRLNPPMRPDETRHLHFKLTVQPRGFENSVSNREFVQNGSFFNNQMGPQIGYQPVAELTEPNKRKKYGLKEKDRMPALERNCTADCRNSYLSNNSDLVNLETVISTSPGQIAIAPGSLIKEWNQNGRHYFQYKLDHPSYNFYSWLSAGYQVAREEYKGVNIEVYYLKEHAWNVPKMLRSVRKSLEYYTTNFGPYRPKQARIIEFPRIARFAQAFPGTMPYSEAIGFIADLKKPSDIDMVYYVVAHEMGHQWWAYQVLGANMQGATVLSETLAQYSALMVMEKEYGRDTMRRFLEYEMDNYLRSRGRELLKEQPLYKVESSQGYIHYRKGSVVMYYLKEMIGEDKLNAALRKVIQQYAYTGSPYPVSYALIDAIREQTPPELQYLLKDLFEDITLFSNRTLNAQATKRPDGKYDVTVDVDAHKFHADNKGNETEIPVNDWIEIGAFAKPAKGEKFGRVLHRERIHMTSGHATYRFITDQVPDKAGIDPFLLLIDRIPDDNLKAVRREELTGAAKVRHNLLMAARQCHHCKQWIEEGEAHNCWTTTEEALTRQLSKDLREAWQRLRETAASFGEQRIYASHKSIMFSRRSCYFFIRPRRNSLELCVFLGREVQSSQVRRREQTSKSKLAHFISVTHRDEVEAPLTDWLREAYELSDQLSAAATHAATARKSPTPQPAPEKPDNGKQLVRLRRICRSLPGTTEKVSHGAPTFFSPERVYAIFANNHHGDGQVAAWLPAAPGAQAALIEESPETYFRPPYVGVKGWVGVKLSKVSDEQLGAMVREAFRLATRKTPAPRQGTPPRRGKLNARG